MLNRLKYPAIALTIAMLVGAVGSYLFDLHFWMAALVAGLALLANGLLAVWEDRGTFND